MPFIHEIDQINELRFGIDDMTPEEMAVALDHIRCTQGVLDVCSHPGSGKKGRAMFTVSVLCTTEAEAMVSSVCFSETSTLGIRVQYVTRRILNRSETLVDDTEGSSHIKLAERPGHTSAKVASDDLQSLRTLEARRKKAQRVSDQIKRQHDGLQKVHQHDSDSDCS